MRRSGGRTRADEGPAPGHARLEMEFDRPEMLGALFGQFDQNLITVENRLGVYIAARGNRLLIDGEPLAIARARDVLDALYRQVARGRPVEQGDVEAEVLQAADAATEPGRPGVERPTIRTRRRTIAARNAAQGRYIEALAAHELVFALGPAGTGKTYLAVAQAVAMLLQGQVQRIILSRPAVEAGERLGFLPGDMRDKVDPYLRPLYDALYDMLPAEQVERRLASGEIEVAPIAFMRGRTLAHAFVILDEAQNTSPMQMKMFLTRFGEGSRMVVCGDPRQVDLPAGQSSGLADAVQRLESVQGLEIVRFGAGDVVRHPLVGRIVQAYEGPDG